MALINCQDCGKSVSESAASCPQCGRPISSAQPAAKTRASGDAGAITILLKLAGVLLIIGALFVPAIIYTSNAQEPWGLGWIMSGAGLFLFFVGRLRQ